jgi:hypothetical protein
MLWLIPVSVGAAPSKHRLIVTFQYDFTIERPCKKKETGECVKQFIIYDITDPVAPLTLFSISVDPKVKRVHHQVKAQSNLRLTDGVHTFAATAQWANGRESDPKACTTIVTIRPQQLNQLRSHPGNS